MNNNADNGRLKKSIDVIDWVSYHAKREVPSLN